VQESLYKLEEEPQLPAVLTPDDDRVITVYPNDQCTVETRRAEGRLLFLNR
jgi:hypothetical protein